MKARYQFFAQNPAGDVLPGATVTVRSELTNALATLWSDPDGTVPKANPFTADGDGYAFFHTNDGNYKVTVTKGLASREYRYVDIYALPDIASSVSTLLTTTRTILLADRAYYVRTDGNDANDGRSNTAGGAFKTIQKAIDTVASLDLSIRSVTVNIADGTYVGAVALKDPLGAGVCYLIGNIASPQNVVIDGSAVSSVIYSDGSRKWSIGGFSVKMGPSVVGINSAASTALITLTYPVKFTGTGTPYIHLFANNRGIIRVNANYTIDISGSYHILSTTGASISVNNTSIPLAASLSFSIFAYVAEMSYLTVYNPVFTGTATGTKYAASGLSLISTGGAGINYFPGDVAGYTALGAEYA